MIRRIGVLCLAALVARTAVAQDDSQLWDYVPGSVLVSEPVTEGAVPARLASEAAEKITAYVTGKLLLKPVSLASLTKRDRRMAYRALRRMQTCGAGKCYAAAAWAARLRVETILLPVLERTANGFRLTLIGFDGRSGKVSDQASREILSEAEVEQAAPDVAHLLLQHEPRDGMGYIRVAAPPGTILLLDGAPAGRAPLTVPLRVAAGPHTVLAELRGATPYKVTVTVERGRDVWVHAAITPPAVAAGPAPKPSHPAPTAPSLSDLPEEVAPPPPVKAPVPVPEHRRPTRAGWVVGWVATVAGACALAAGVGLGVAANGNESRLRTTKQPAAEVQSEVTTARSQAAGADVLFGVGGALAVTGISLVVVFR